MPSLPTPTTNIFASSLHALFFRRRRQSYELNPPEQTHQVIYLGNVLTAGLGKGEASVDKPLSVIWRTWNAKRGQRQQIGMRLSATRSGLKAETKQLGLTEYWAHRITFCLAPPQYPRVFCWVYKHEGKRMKPELRCHAVLCKKANEPAQLQQMLSEYLHAALQEYKREKLAAERARKNSLLSTCPRRKILLQTGSLNFRPPVSRSRSAPRLGSIDEEDEEFGVENLAPIANPPLASPLPKIAVDLGHHQSNNEEEEFCHNGEEEVSAEEEMEEFSDLDANSLNLEANYRTTPVLSGDSSSQQSAPSVSSCGGDKCCDDDEESEEEEEDDTLINAAAAKDGHHHHPNTFVEDGDDVEDCSVASTSSKASISSAVSNASKSSTTSGNSSLQSNCTSSSTSSIEVATQNVTSAIAAFRLTSPSSECSFNRASQFRTHQQRKKGPRVPMPTMMTTTLGINVGEDVDDGIEEGDQQRQSSQTTMLYGHPAVLAQRKAGTLMVSATFGRQEIRL